MKLKRILQVMVLFSFILLLGGCNQTDTGEVPAYEPVEEVSGDDFYEVGSIFPLTGDGAAYGIPMQKALQLAVDEINSQGGINGKQLKVIYEDGQCDGSEGAKAAQKLINLDGVKVIIGGICSDETLGAAPIAEDNQVVLISPGSSSAKITFAGDYIFRNYPSDAAGAAAVARKAIEDGHTKMAVISEVTEYVESLREVFVDTYTGLGGNIIIEERFAPEVTDLRTPLAKIKESDVTAIYPVTQTFPKASLLVKQMQEIGIELPVYTSEILTSKEVLDEHGDYLEGTIYPEVRVDKNSPKARAFINMANQKEGEEFIQSMPFAYLAASYDVAYILKDILAICGDQDGTCVKNELYKVQNWEGSMGMVSIDENGDPIVEFGLKAVQNGEIVVIS